MSGVSTSSSPQQRPSMSSAHGESSRLAKDFTSSEGEAEVEADSEAPAINPAHSPDAPRDGSRERNPLSAGSSAEALTGTSKLSAGASPSLKLPTAVIGGKPPRKKSEMDWLHAGPSNKGGSAKADGEAGSSSAAQPSDAAPSKPQKKRPPQKRTAPAATGTGTPDAPASLSVHREVPSSTTAVMYEDPYAEEDELDALNGPASPQPQPPAQPPLAVQRIKLIPPPMPGLMRKMAEGSVAGSEGADAPPKKKRRPPQSRKPAVPGPGKAWRKGLKEWVYHHFESEPIADSAMRPPVPTASRPNPRSHPLPPPSTASSRPRVPREQPRHTRASVRHRTRLCRCRFPRPSARDPAGPQLPERASAAEIAACCAMRTCRRLRTSVSLV